MRGISALDIALILTVITDRILISYFTKYAPLLALHDLQAAGLDAGTTAELLAKIGQAHEARSLIQTE